MKKVQKALALGLCLALGASALVACGGKNNNGDNDGKKPAGVPYWLSGNIAGEELWGDNDEGSYATDARRLSKTDKDNVYAITLDMWKDDIFKIRYDGKSFDDWQRCYDKGFNETQKTDPDAKIGDGGGYAGQKNFGVLVEGNYTITLDMTDGSGTVSYTYNGEATNKQPHPVRSIKVDKEEVSLEVGSTHQIVATTVPANADDQDFSYESDDDGIATVDENGLITAVSVGDAIITVRCGGKTKDITVTVIAEGSSIHAESITLNKEATTLHMGATETLTAIVAPDGVTDTTGWESSNDDVVTVVGGVLTPVAPGTATITAKNGEKSATCEVTVVKDLYIVGTGKTDVLTGFNVQTKLEAIPESTLMTEADGVYTLTANLDNGAEFQILTLGAGNDGWAGQLGASALAEEDTENGINLSSQVGGTSNIRILADGQYQITVNAKGKVEVKRLGDATVEFPWEYDVLFRGTWTGEKDEGGNAVWTDIKFGDTVFDKDHLTVTANIELTAAAFGVKTAETGTTGQAGWFNSNVMELGTGVDGITLNQNDNATCTKAGTYNVTVTLNAGGAITKILFNSYTAPAEA